METNHKLLSLLREKALKMYNKFILRLDRYRKLFYEGIIFEVIKADNK